jgi:hypothetical protein
MTVDALAGRPAALNETLALESDEDFTARAYAEGWTDGLPVVAPTPERVEQMLAATDRDPLEVLGIMPPGQGVATVHAVAVNAVMAGCDPAHLPVVLAAVRAVLEPQFNLNAVQTTTNPVTPAIMVNGPLAAELGFHGGVNCFGPGPESRSNAVVGRALRFVLMNVGYGTPGKTDMSTQGQPGKYTFCFAEHEAASPWEPHHVERGHAADTSCVTVFPAGSVSNILDFGSKTAESLLTSIANLLSVVTTNNMQLSQGDLLIALGPEHAEILGREGLTKDDIKRFLHLNARTPAHRFSEGIMSCIRDWRSAELRLITDDTPIPVVNDWKHINVVVAGGISGSQSAFIAGFEAWSVCVEI